MPGKNNRRAQNRDRHDSVLEVYDGTGKSIAWTAKLVDFSAGGAAFSATRLLMKGTRLHACVRILGKGTIEIFGHVVWSRRKTNTNLYGIKFDSIKNMHPM